MKPSNNNDGFSRDRRDRNDREDNQMGKIDRIIIDIQRQLRDSIAPVELTDLNPFERKRIHAFFDNKPEFKTRTYRDDNDGHVFRVYPIGNLKKYVDTKVKEALEKRETIKLPPMGNFERFIIHDHLKDLEDIETTSQGENEARHIELVPKKFGRTLKRIIKKMKLL
jgi:predicted RNA-binding protein Jag